MKIVSWATAAGLIAVITAGSSTWAESTPPTPDTLMNEITALKEQLQSHQTLIQAQQAQIRDLKRQTDREQEAIWLDDRRAEEVKALVREVLHDADTRASLLEDGITAGHNGQNFYLASNDGSYMLRIEGLLQTRYLYNHRKEAASVGFGRDSDESGFEIARTKLEFSGHVANPRVQYLIRIGVDREDNEVLGERVVIGYQLFEDQYVDDLGRRYGGLTIWAGEDKAPFLREEIIGPAQQLAVDRSLMNEVFTAGYVQGVWITWNALESISLAVSINDGIRSGEADNEENSTNLLNTDPVALHKPFFEDRTDIAITARLDFKVAGQWLQYADFAAWSGEDLAVFIGAAIHYEVGETGSRGGSGAPEDNTFLIWTVDGSLEVGGLSLYAAIAGFHSNNVNQVQNFPSGNAIAGVSDGHDLDIYGVVMQASYMVIPDKLEPFIRFEWIDLDGNIGDGTSNPGFLNSFPVDEDDQIALLTFGANYYINRHQAKFTLDMTWVFSQLPDSTFLGLQDNISNDPSLGAIGLRQDASGSDDQIAIRAQFQLLF